MPKRYEKIVNEVHCPEKGHGKMKLTVDGDFDHLYVETYVCTHKKCDNQASLYLGGRNLSEHIRKFYTIEGK
jgi:hypothetical protein